jgi:hypothetical protein
MLLKIMAAFFTLCLCASAAGAQLQPAGSFAQVAYGAGWSTTLYLINTSTTIARVQWTYYYAPGKSETGTVEMSQGAWGPFLPRIGINAPLHTTALISGWISVSADVPLRGYGVASWRGLCPDVRENIPCPGNPYFAELIPLDTELASFGFELLTRDTTSLYRPVDSDSFEDAVAIANMGNQPTQVEVTFHQLLGDGQPVFPAISIPLGPKEHRSLFLRDIFLTDIGGGFVRFASSTTPITGAALRFNPSGSFTSIPIIRSLN